MQKNYDMRRYTITELQQMRESEDHVEFKKGEGGNVSYNGQDKKNPKMNHGDRYLIHKHKV